MPFNVGTMSMYDDANSIHDPIVLAAASAIDLPANKGKVYEMMGAPLVPVSQFDVDIYSRSVSEVNGVIGDGTGAGGGWDNTATTSLKMTPEAIARLTVGFVLKIESEVVRITSVNRTANTVSANRGLGGTTMAAHADATSFEVIGFAGNDSDLKNVESFKESTLKYRNYCQTFFELIDWEKGAELERQGLKNSQVVTILKQEAMLRMAQKLAKAAVHGVKHKGDSSTAHLSAGLLTQLADDASGQRPILTYNANGTLTETKLRAALKEAFKVGNPNRIIVSYTNKETINNFNFSNSNLQVGTDVKNNTAGSNIDYYNYEGNILKIEIDADMPDDKIAVITKESIKKGWLKNDTLANKTEPALSSRENRESIQGSIVFIVENVGYDHILMTGITQA